MSAANYALLTAFQNLFEGTAYLHRNSSLGDKVASYLYEDLYNLNKSTKLRERIDAHVRVLNVQNRTVGIARRRGDGTFGELVPSASVTVEKGLAVARGPVATIEIGVETKILAKAMSKQIDRVMADLVRQTQEFKKRGGNPICVGVVGVNSSGLYTSYEGARAFLTNGSRYRHPIQEAATAVSRLELHAAPSFDEFLILKFIATNTPPHPFSWVDEKQTTLEYSALLTRVSRDYDRRFA